MPQQLGSDRVRASVHKGCKCSQRMKIAFSESFYLAQKTASKCRFSSHISCAGMPGYDREKWGE